MGTFMINLTARSSSPWYYVSILMQRRLKDSSFASISHCEKLAHILGRSSKVLTVS
jgi:hypothetical protein